MPPTFEERTGSHVLVAIAALTVAMISVQVGAALSKQLFPVVGPAGATTLRLIFATLILWAVWRPWRHWPKAGGWRPLLAYGTALGAMNLTFYMSLSRIPLGVAVALEFTGPLVVAVATSRRLRDLIYVAMAVAGVLLLLPLHAGSAHIDPVGALLALIAGGFWAAYIIFGQKAGRAAHSGSVAAIGMVVATVVALPAGIAQAGADLLRPELLPIAALVALLSSAIPYSLEMMSLKRLPAQTFSILLSAEPMFGALFGLILLDERLTAIQGLAIALIVAASAGSSISAARNRPAPKQG